MTRAVRLTELAEADIAEAQAWYEKKRPGLGVRFVERVGETMERVAENPLQFQIFVADVRRADVTKFPYGVYYRVEADGSVVVACLHHRRDLKLARSRALMRKPQP